MGKYIEIADKAQFDSLVKEGVTFVDFWAPWCAPCRALAPVFEDLAEKYKESATFAKCNVDEDEHFARKHGMVAVLWDNGAYQVTGQDYNEKYGFYNRRNQTWYFPEILEAIHKGCQIKE